MKVRWIIAWALFLCCMAWLATALVLMNAPQKTEQSRISFSIGEDTVVDRGYAEYERYATYYEPAHFRYQNESFGTCLYLYDETLTLKSRIINPENVVLD